MDKPQSQGEKNVQQNSPVIENKRVPNIPASQGEVPEQKDIPVKEDGK